MWGRAEWSAWSTVWGHWPGCREAWRERDQTLQKLCLSPCHFSWLGYWSPFVFSINENFLSTRSVKGFNTYRVLAWCIYAAMFRRKETVRIVFSCGGQSACLDLRKSSHASSNKLLFRINVQWGSSSEHWRTKKNRKNRKRKHKHEASPFAD